MFLVHHPCGVQKKVMVQVEAIPLETFWRKDIIRAQKAQGPLEIGRWLIWIPPILLPSFLKVTEV